MTLQEFFGISENLISRIDAFESPWCPKLFIHETCWGLIIIINDLTFIGLINNDEVKSTCWTVPTYWYPWPFPVGISLIIRMEPVFMILGQSAATVACMSIEENIPVQEVPYSLQRKKLIEDGQVLEYKK